jgi:hypothetical protein
MFLILMVVGLAGLAMLAVPALTRHGAPAPGHPTHAHAGTLGHGAHGAAVVRGVTLRQGQPTASTAKYMADAAEGGSSAAMLPGDAARVGPAGLARWLPSPRGVFTLLALFGAFANAYVEVFHSTRLVAALAAVIPTALVDRWMVRPLWNLVFKLQATPSAPLGALVLNDAVAVVPFRNGRGVVSTHRDGRVVQLAARLCDEDATRAVKVGDRLRIEEVDPGRERVTVSVLREK